MRIPTAPDLAPPFADIAPWPPQRFTPPLSDDFVSAFDAYRNLFRLVWFAAFGYMLEAWQEQTIRHILEVYPTGHPRAGQLRFRQVVVSLGRQNGKTEIAAALGLWALLVRAAPTVIGIASSEKQARLVYQRTMQAIRRTPRLGKMFRALTETRGIQKKDGGTYEIRAAKSDALQGIPIDLGMVDELHLVALALWFDLVNGLGGRPNGLVVGITTAGDDGSELLLHLYAEGNRAIADGDTARFGFFVWEALKAEIPADDTELSRELARANPGVASGRTDLENSIAEVRSMPAQDAIRYRLNRFVTKVSTFITGQDWADNKTADPFPDDVRPTFVIDRTTDWKHANISVFGRVPDGRTYCDLAAVVVKPSLAQLADLCADLAKHDPITFAVDPTTLKDLGRELESRGLPVHYATAADIANGSALLYSKVTRRELAHPGNQLLATQIPTAKRRDSDGGFKVSRKESRAAIDTVIAHLIGVQLVETQRGDDLQMF